MIISPPVSFSLRLGKQIAQRRNVTQDSDLVDTIEKILDVPQKDVKKGLDKKSVADCLQTRPVDINARLNKILGVITDEEMEKINQALKILFELG